MAILKTDDNQVEVTNGEAILNAAEELGVPFGCRAGVCGTCKTKVIEGMENLSEKNEQENEMDLEEGERLMCQCKIKSGEVKIQVDE